MDDRAYAQQFLKEHCWRWFNIGSQTSEGPAAGSFEFQLRRYAMGASVSLL
jgi:hypothetical protein